MSPNTEYIQYLNSRKTDQNDLITHTRIGDKSLNIYGGKYYIPPEELPTFYKLYYEHVFINNHTEYLTEKQLIDKPRLND